MDEELREQERRAEREPGPEAWRAAARACLRRGLVRRALEWARGEPGSAEHEAAALGLAARLGCELRPPGPTRAEVFRTPHGHDLALIPAGTYLEEGARAWASLLRPGSDRAPLRPVHLPDYLIAVEPVEPTFTEVADAPLAELRARGGRLATPAEWKKAWRGGVYLDGDRTRTRPNPEPDRLVPEVLGSGVSGYGFVSPYGLLYLAVSASEWELAEEGALCLTGFDLGRYQARYPGRGPFPVTLRAVLDLPADPD